MVLPIRSHIPLQAMEPVHIVGTARLGGRLADGDSRLLFTIHAISAYPIVKFLLYALLKGVGNLCRLRHKPFRRYIMPLSDEALVRVLTYCSR